MKKRSYNEGTPPTTTTQLGPIYDDVKLPETSEQKEIIELQGNAAYYIINSILEIPLTVMTSYSILKTLSINSEFIYI